MKITCSQCGTSPRILCCISAHSPEFVILILLCLKIWCNLLVHRCALIFVQRVVIFVRWFFFLFVVILLFMELLSTLIAHRCAVHPSSYTVVQTVVIFVPLLLFLSIYFCLLLLLLMDKLSTLIAYRCTLILIHSRADRSGCSSVSLSFKFLFFFFNFQKYYTFCDFAGITQ